MGWSNATGIIEGFTLIISTAGNNTGIFVYNGTPASGNLVGSWAAAAGTDAFGNAYPEGISVYGTGASAGSSMMLDNATLSWTQAAWLINALISTSVPGATPLMTIEAPATNAVKLNASIQLEGPTNSSSSLITLTAAQEIDLNVGTGGNFTVINSNGVAAFGGETWHALSLANGWAFGGAPFVTPRYRLSAEGLVMIQGLISGGTNANGTVVATLPAGYRPGATIQLVASADGLITPGVCVLHISSAGNITVFGLGTADVISFDGISFPIPPYL